MCLFVFIDLQVLCYLAPLFPKNINLFWQDEVYRYVHKTDLEFVWDPLFLLKFKIFC